MTLPRWSWFDFSSWFSMMTFEPDSSSQTISTEKSPAACSRPAFESVMSRQSFKISMFSSSQRVKSSASCLNASRSAMRVIFWIMLSPFRPCRRDGRLAVPGGDTVFLRPPCRRSGMATRSARSEGFLSSAFLMIIARCLYRIKPMQSNTAAHSAQCQAGSVPSGLAGAGTGLATRRRHAA